MLNILFTLVVILILPILINKIDKGSMNWIDPYLRECWIFVFIIISAYFLRKPKIKKFIQKLYKRDKLRRQRMLEYLVCFFIGGSLLCGYWWFIGMIIKPPTGLIPQSEVVSEKKLTTKKIEPEVTKKLSEKLISENKVVPNRKPKEENNKPPQLPKLQALFQQDFSRLLKFEKGGSITFNDGTILNIDAQEYMDLEAKTKFLGFYIPFSNKSYAACEVLSEYYKKCMDDLDSSIEVRGGHIADSARTSSRDLMFSNRIYIYHENNFSLQELAILERLYQSRGLSVVFRGDAYLFSMWQDQKAHKAD